MRHAKYAADAGRKFNAAGKVVLAAIVHHETISTSNLNGQSLQSATNYGDQANDATQEQQQDMTKNGGKNARKQTGNNTYEDDKSFSSSSKRKFSKLFSKKKQQATTTETTKTNIKTTSTLIDNAKSNGNSERNDRIDYHLPPPKCIQGELPNSNDHSYHSPSLHHQNYKYPKQQTTCESYHNKNKADQVIEFKFDLIVDQDQQSMWNCAASNTISGADQMAATAFKQAGSLNGTANSVDSNDTGEGDIMKHKLNDNVNELVESFVLDSNDVCLMSIGAQRADLNNKHHFNGMQQEEEEQLKGPEVEEFEYLSKLAAHTLAYSFQLLNSGQRHAANGNEKLASNRYSGGQQPSPDVQLMSLECSRGNLEATDKSSPLRRDLSSSAVANNYSIELSATLFLCSETDEVSAEPIDVGADHSHPECDKNGQTAPPTHQQAKQTRKKPEGCFSIIDLLACDGLADTMNGGPDHACRVKQWSEEDDERRRAFTKGSASSLSVDCPTVEDALATVERVRSKLGQLQKDGRLSTNKKSLIISMKLKQRINGGLFSNRMCLIDFRPNFSELQPIFESIFNGQALAHLKRQKVHLQSLESNLLIDNSNLGDDELTKQHHQVASQNKLIQAEWLLYKQLSSALIRTLLVVHVHKLVLPIHQAIINKTITKLTTEMYASYEHQLMRDNLILLEFARSIQRASSVRLKRRKRHLRSHLASSNVSVASNMSATTTTNEVLSSPLRTQHNTILHSPIARSHANCELPYSSDNYHGSYNRKASLDMNLALSRHHLRHHHQRGSTHNRNNYNISTARHLANRFHTLQRQSDFTESSSISTSSGSQRTQQICSPVRSSRATHRSYKQERNNCFNNLSSLNNLSDSDSVTSANLNSCSSSSYNRLPSGQHWRSKHASRDVVELKRLARQKSKLLKHSSKKPSSPSSPSIELSSLACRTAQQQRSSSTSRSRERSVGSRGREDIVVASKRASSVIQIDCQPSSRRVTDLSSGLESASHKTHMTMQMGDGDTIANKSEGLDDMTDNVSDICSVIAEPPKQLKLEEFLNQLSSMIAPITTNSLDKQNGRLEGKAAKRTSRQVSMTKDRKDIASDGVVTNHMMYSAHGYDNDGMMKTNVRQQQDYTSLVDGKQRDSHLTGNRANGNGVADEDDEDCKSHSSILEHLSSLALESNTKFNNRQLQLDYERIRSHHLNGFPTERTHVDREEHEIALQQSSNRYTDTIVRETAVDMELSVQDHNPTGHLQRLLNSSAQFRKTSNSRVIIRDPSSIEDQLRALSITCQENSNSTSPSASPGAFITSNESTCSSSSTSAVVSSTIDDKIANLAKMKPSLVHYGSASVTSRNHHQNVKT